MATGAIRPTLVPPPVKTPVPRETAAVVNGWAATIRSEAPPRTQRDFAEYMSERLPELIEALDATA